jgi:hypothetical protein
MDYKVIHTLHEEQSNCQANATADIRTRRELFWEPSMIVGGAEEAKKFSGDQRGCSRAGIYIGTFSKVVWR